MGPSPLQAGRTAKFAFESTEPAITFRCALLSGETIVRAEDWMSCTSPKVAAALISIGLAGSHEQLEVNWPGWEKTRKGGAEMQGKGGNCSLGRGRKAEMD